MPGTRTQQATTLGGATGAALGHALHDQNRVLGALVGGALGAGGGWVVRARTAALDGNGFVTFDEGWRWSARSSTRA